MFNIKHLLTSIDGLTSYTFIIPTHTSANQERFTFQAELLDSRLPVHRDQDVPMPDTVSLRAGSVNTPHRGCAGRSALEARAAHLHNMLK